jgi:type IV secretory pathway VirB3-like protein
MRKSPVCYTLTKPDLTFGLPKDYAMCALGVTGIVGGIIPLLIFGKLGFFIGVLVCGCLFWVVGYFMTKKDPEFFGVWLKMAFGMGGKDGKASLNGKRSYEP